MIARFSLYILLDKFQSLIYADSYDIIRVSETWMTSEIYSNEILP